MVQVEAEGTRGRFVWGYLPNNSPGDMPKKLLRFVAEEAARRKLHFLTAAVPENSPELELFSSAGYSHVTHRRVWRYQPAISPSVKNEGDMRWRRFRAVDCFAANALQSRLLKPRAKLISEAPSEHPPDFVLETGGELVGYAHSLVSLQRAYITPSIDPARAEAEIALDLLLGKYFRTHKEIYFCEREGQRMNADQFSGELSAAFAPQAVLVKQLAVRLHDPLINLDTAGNQKTSDTILPISEIRAREDNI